MAHYEGQAACELEAIAERSSSCYPYSLVTGGDTWEIDTRPVFRSLLEDLRSGRSMGEMAGKFHTTLAAAIVETCRLLSGWSGLKRIALSGGVFQNELLTAMVVEGLDKVGLACYLHGRVPCNDGGISLGQAVVAARRREGQVSNIELSSNNCK